MWKSTKTEGLIPSLRKFDSCGGFPNRHLSDSPWQTAFERFAMSTPVPLRSDFDTIGLRMLARRSRDPDQTRRLLALAEIYDGGPRPDEARIGGVGVQIVRDWVVRFNAKGPDGLLNGKAPGARSILDERQRRALRQAVEDGPIPALHGVVRWRLIDLAQWLFEEFRVSISKPTLRRELPAYGHTPSSRRDRAITASG